LSSFITACGQKQDKAQCDETAVTIDDAREDILVIGDSISIGYTPFIKEAFPQYDVMHTPCNSRWSSNGVAKIDFWLSMRPQWKAITFNHGLWDMQRVDGTSLADYEANLRIIADKIKAATPNPVFIMTTGIPLHADGKFCLECELDYQAVAMQVMQDKGIPVVDLYTVSNSILQYHQQDELQNNVHFSSIGYSILADTINNYLNGVL
jgi:hypothetical protein